MSKPTGKTIPGYTGKYLIFEDGSVFSYPRLAPSTPGNHPGQQVNRKNGGHYLKPSTHNGKRIAVLYSEGKKKVHYISDIMRDVFGVEFVPPSARPDYVSRFPREPGYTGYDVWEDVPGPDSIDMGQEAWS